MPVVPASTAVSAPKSNRAADPAGVSVSAVGSVARSAALDMHEGNALKTKNECTRWPARMRLLASTGEVVKGRCKSTNLCDYCARLSAVENSEMLALDALMGVAPTIYAVTSTPNISQDTRQYRRAVQSLVQAWRRRFPDLEYGCIVEFTTGRAGTSGGHRRPHWNWFFKGVTDEDIPELRAIIERVWCPSMRANGKGQYVGAIANEGGLLRYLAMHFQKESQRPPEGWKGHRLRMSRGYLLHPTPQMRDLTHASLRLRRELWKASRDGYTGEDVHSVAMARLQANESITWRLVSWAEVEAHREKRPWTREWVDQAVDDPSVAAGGRA